MLVDFFLLVESLVGFLLNEFLIDLLCFLIYFYLTLFLV